MVRQPALSVRRIPYWHVDAFSAAPFGGNQAAVMSLDEWLPDETLVQIGAENMFAETAFLVRDETGDADWRGEQLRRDRFSGARLDGRGRLGIALVHADQ